MGERKRSLKSWDHVHNGSIKHINTNMDQKEYQKKPSVISARNKTRKMNFSLLSFGT